ncbi:MAG TPA: class I SAM-dependent methyltransferase [Bryobacteraceae bacterium]|jgi:SAM-dependent methyltransferase
MNCDRIARCYRWLEYFSFGRALERRRREYLDEVERARSVLILGDGDGRFTAEFLGRNKQGVIDSVELSPCMLALAKQRVEQQTAGADRLRFWQADARTMELPREYDLIVSHFFLDCFTPDDLDALVARIASAARPGARWILSEFRVPDRGIQRFAGGVLIQIMYWFFRVATGLKTSRVPEYRTIFRVRGFRCLGQRSAWGGLMASELWEKVER